MTRTTDPKLQANLSDPKFRPPGELEVIGQQGDDDCAGSSLIPDSLENNPAKSKLPPVIEVEILAPEHGSSHALDLDVRFRASASGLRLDGGIGRIRWESDLDGYLGTGRIIAKKISQGIHTISASVAHPSGRRVTATIGISTRSQVSDPWCTSGGDT